MKTNLKANSVLSVMLLGCSAAFLSSCEDFTNGFTYEQLTYEAQFAKEFGNIDPTNDFNLAQRGEVTVTPNGNHEVCVYKKAANGYQLIARYDDVTSTRTLGFDIPKGETEILVVNGSETQVTTVGGTVTFGSATRAGNFDGKDGPLSVSLNEGKDYTYLYYNATEATSFGSILPESSSNKDKAIDDFSLISTGEFIIYPTYWNAGIASRLGIYYYDNAGNIHKKVICGNHGYNESIQYLKNGDWVTENTIYGGCNGNSHTWVSGHEALTSVVGATNYRSKGIIINLPVGTKFGFYTPMFDDSPSNFAGTDLTFEETLEKGVSQGAIHHLNTNIYVPNNLLESKNGCSGLGGDQNLQTKRSFGRWWFLKNGEVVEATWTKNRELLDAHSESNLNPPDAWDKKYIDKSVWDGVNFNAPNSPLKYDRHAVMFALYYDDKGDMVIGAEDSYYLSEWNASDYDLNDKMFKIYGSQPLVLNNKAQSWHLAFEDLGGSFDWDFNDVVLQIDYVSGQSKAHITPIAAGGTLHSEVFFDDSNDGSNKQDLGEIHELLGATHVDDEVLYEPINASRRGVPGVRKEVNIKSPSTFSIANAMNDANSAGLGSSKNILGLYIETSGNEEGTTNTIAYQDAGKAPMMLVLPTSYKSGEKYYEWAWPTERTDIRKAYNTEGHKFTDWVADHTQAQDWYEHPTTSMTVDAKVAGKYANGATTAGSEYENQTTYGTTISFPKKTDKTNNMYVFDVSSTFGNNATSVTITLALKGIVDNQLQAHDGSTTTSGALGTWKHTSSGGTFTTVGEGHNSGTTNVNIEGLYQIELSEDDVNKIKAAGHWAITAGENSEIIYIAFK